MMGKQGVLLLGVVFAPVLMTDATAAAQAKNAPDDAGLVRPFKVAVDDSVLRDLRDRLGRTRFPDQIPGSDWTYGPDAGYMKELVTYWREKFDWRAQEARLNSLPQFTTVIDGIDLHFIHVRSKQERATPLLLVHGWPGSVVEFQKIIGPLTDPEAHGGQARDAFHVVAPSLPGFGFSGKPREPGWTSQCMAETLAKLMARLGYAQYGAQGGDWGGGIVRWLAANDPRCLGAHSNFPPFIRPDTEPLRDTTQTEIDRGQQRIIELADHKAYGAIQGTRPLALGYGLNDSPAGLAAWIVDKFWAWSDHGGRLENSFTRDELLTNITLYWVTESMPSSTRIYFESQRNQPRPPSMTPFEKRIGKPAPMGYALFPKEINVPPRAWVERAVPNVIHWTEMTRGGHFAAMEQPTLLVNDMRAFFGSLRRDQANAAVGEKKSESVAVGTEMQLFADDRVIERMTGVTRELGTVTKANDGQPVSFWRAGPDGKRRRMPAWQLFHTVYYDDARRVFRVWCRGLTGDDAVLADGSPDWDKVRYVYCESTDGVNFDLKAELQGLYSRGDYNLVVTFDERESDPEHRYRIGYDGGRPEFPNGACLAHSSDGIHWTPYNDGKPVTGRAADFSNQVFWDGDARLYRLFTRTDYGAAGGVDERRGVRMMTNPDVKRDPANWTVVRNWQFDREGPMEWKRRQPYMMTDWIYHGVHFALMSVYEWPVDYSEGTATDHFTRHERDINNFYIATSRDADHWDLRWVYEGKAFVPRGGNGAWDKDLAFPSSRIETLEDKHWIYYGGCNERHGTPGVCLPNRDPGIGLAWLRLDGFIGLRAGAAPGTVVTRPFRLEGRELLLNVEARAGEVNVGVLDTEGRPIAGFSPDEAWGYRGSDELRLKPRWKDHADLSALRGRDVRLEFRLQNANLFSFQVR